MTIKEADANLGRIVRYKTGVYRLTAIVKRWTEKGLCWQCELTDAAHKNSVVICRADKVEALGAAEEHWRLYEIL